MKILNLAEPDKGDVSFKIFSFPDGQQDVVIEPKRYRKGVIINSRFNSWRDLELIVAVNQALRALRVKKISLYIPYLLGARSDRKFEEGGNSYLRDVLAPIINAQKFRSVWVLDAHSDVTAAVIKRLKPITNYLPDFAIKSIYGQDWNKDKPKFKIVSPDAGAYKKIFETAKDLGFNGEIITAQKHRDLTTGKVTHVSVPFLGEDEITEYVIFDDICDGGRTFIEMANSIRKQRPNAKIFLVVTHGIFSAGTEPFAGIISGVFTTNSIKDIRDLFITQLKIV